MFGRSRLVCWMPVLLAVGSFCAALCPTAQADQWNHETKVTFLEPVEIPGKILPAGTYTFQLMDSSSNRNIVEIFNRRDTQLDAFVLAIPAYRLTPAGGTIFTLEERASNLPPALHKWFFPGVHFGQEFLYSRRAQVSSDRPLRRGKAAAR